jgi:hypothetical protein
VLPRDLKGHLPPWIPHFASPYIAIQIARRTQTLHNQSVKLILNNITESAAMIYVFMIKFFHYPYCSAHYQYVHQCFSFNCCHSRVLRSDSGAQYNVIKLFSSICRTCHS